MWHFILVSFITGLTAATSNDATSASDYMNEAYNISYNAFNTGAGILFIFIGWSTIFFAPLSSLYGRRITYIICLLAGTFGSLWFGLTKKTSDSLYSQIFVGMSELCAEAQVQQSISDIFFQHQLGSALTVYIMATSIGSFLGPLIANYIAEGQNFRWIGYWGAIICGVTTLVVLFAGEETVFDRTKYIPIIESSKSATPSVEDSGEGTTEKKNSDGEFENITTKTTKDVHATTTGNDGPRLLHITSENPNAEERELHADVEDPMPYWKRVALITPSPTLVGFGFKQYCNRFLQSFRVFTIPAVWFSGILWGLQDTYMTFFLTTQADFFVEAPWNYSQNGVAIMNVATLVGSVIGCLFSGVLSDYHVLWLAKRNNSVYEPEMRLWLLAATLIISPVGLIMFGVGADRNWPPAVIYIGLGFIGFGWGSIGDTAMSYLMDAYPEIVIQGMVGVSIINNTLACIFTFTCSNWLDASGTQNTYIALSVIDFATIACFIPFIIYGKKFRKATKKIYINLVELFG